MNIKRCKLDIEECIQTIKSRITSNGAKIFAEIDHSKNAKDVGLSLGEDRVIIFGNPAAGTILMQIDRKISYDLPLRIAIWKDDNNNTFVEYKMPSEIAKEYGINHNILKKMDEFMNIILEGILE
ncbi:DUF302 domain-containing protein [Acidianus sulfidivorans JP7]|uniref:DUF302 domain-containing protein n=1 Tax=Acidianus sulfidivorans JP7 TaxID=619593 RepID=A0A2U9IPS3_9CREN|nr:DUF302 domain-containing protein [Acidianus sulfidivorans]AWR97974.1 DUF302 domain-containing protein [Acidianus sulfidivorans JP7]